MFFVITKRAIFFIMATLFFVSVTCFFVSSKESLFASANGLTVVIDAGHGGKDNGSAGTFTGVWESDLNLEFSNTLTTYLTNAGFKVVKTRKTKDDLSTNVSGFIKKQDMETRKEIIEKASPDMVLSIHMNKFVADKNQSGAQVFYNPESESSQRLSEVLQKELNKKNKRERINLAADFFMLKCTTEPSALIECGFLSNFEEEKLLQTKEYREELCYSIFIGVMHYFYTEN